MKFKFLFLLALTVPAMAEDAPKPANLLANGGFEKWQTLGADEAAKQVVTLKSGEIAEGYWFNGEAYERGQNPKFPLTVSISKDGTIKHEGQDAVRIENKSTTDISSVALQPVSIAPNTHYVLKGWMKGEGIVQDAKTGLGACVWTNVGPTKDFWGKMRNDLHQVDKKDGTFDWTPFEVKFDSGADEDQLMFSLQLRRASGTIWFDEVSLIAIGQNAPVPTF